MMKEYSKDDIEKGLNCYDPEGRVFPELSKTQQGRKLRKRDVLLILKWKLGRIKDVHSETVNDENMSKINQAVEDARKLGGEIDALMALDQIPGIGLATATAILTVCYPDKFTIIDQRVLGVLGRSPANTDGWTAKKYIEEYLPAVMECRGRWGCTLRDADRALWGLSVNERIEDIIKISKQG